MAGGDTEQDDGAPAAPLDPGETAAPPGAPPPEVEASPQRLGDYELLDEIARGGMGVVYRARQTSLDRVVALKMILAGELAGETAIQRFRFEAEAAANLDHPGIVPVYEVGEDAGRHFFSMGYVEGRSLASRLEEGPLPPREAAELVGGIAEAVAYAHDRGVIHRDLKPANVLLDEEGRPRVTDFGLARRIEDPEELTASGQFLGTPNYMAPEQVRGERGTIGVAADVYALGGLLFALLTGRAPFQAPGVLALLQKVQDEPAPDPRSLVPGLSRDLSTICLECLKKDPAARYPSVAALLDDLRRFLAGEPISARPLAWPGRLQRWARRNPLLSGVIGVVVVSVAVVIAALTSAVRIAEEGQRDAIAERDRANGLRMTAQSSTLVEEEPSLALILAVRGARLAPGPLASGALHAALDACQEQRTLVHPDAVHSAAFSADGARVVTTCEDRKARIWDAQSGALLGVLDGELPHDLGLAELSPSGDRVLTLSRRYGAQLWDASSGELLADLPAPARDATQTSRLGADHENCAAAFSPDGQRVVTAFGVLPGTAAVLWDARSGERLATLQHEGNVVWAGFSPDGQRIVTCSWDMTARVWDGRTGAPGPVLRGHTTGVLRAVFSPSADHVLTLGDGWRRTGDSGTSAEELTPGRVWDLATGEELARLARSPPQRGVVAAASFTPDGARVVTASVGFGNHAPPAVFDAATGAWIRDLKGADDPREDWDVALDIDPRGERVLLTGDERVGLWELASGDKLPLLRGHFGGAFGARFDPSGERVVTWGQDGTARLWKARPARRRFQAVLSGAFSPDGHQVVLSRMTAVEVVRASDGAPLRTLQWPRGEYAWDLAVGRARIVSGNHWAGSFEGPDVKRFGHARAADLSPAEDLVFLAGYQRDRDDPDGGKAVVLDAASGEVLARLGGDVAWINDGLFDPSGERLLTRRDGPGISTSAGEDPSVARVWSARTGEELAVLVDDRRDEGASTMCLAWAADGRQVATGDSTGAARLWNPATGAPIRTLAGHEKPVKSVAFSPDGRRLLTASRDGTARVWSVATGRELVRCVHRGPVEQASFSPDGGSVLTASVDGTARLWSTADGAELVTFQDESREPMRQATFSPDGRWILTVTRNDRARVWHTDPLAAAEAALPRDPTPAERERFAIPEGER